jgi:hypothetical protein
MAAGDDDYGRLLLSRYQVNQLLFAKRQTKAPALRIALLHHPWSYLAEFDQNDARALIHQHCDLVLRGHLHQARTERIVPPAAGRACLELAAGCVYEGGNYPNAYQWVEIEPDTQTVTVRFRTWNQHEWCCAGAPSSTGPGSCDRRTGSGASPRAGTRTSAFAVCWPRAASLDPVSIPGRA